MGLQEKLSKLIRKKKAVPQTPPLDTPTTATEVVPTSKGDSPSLWDTAYDQLKDRKPGLIKKYEGVLLTKPDDNDVDNELSKLDEEAPIARRTQMQRVAEQGLKRVNESRQSRVLEGITRTAQVLSSVKEASTVWAGICFALPLVENLTGSMTAMRDGFVYLTSRMEYYAAFEKVLFRPAEQTSKVLGSLVRANEADVVRLYGQIIEYIAQCVIQIHYSKTKQVVRGMLDLDGWEARLKSIKETEMVVARNAEQMGTAQGQETISRLRIDSAQMVELLQSFLQISREQLLVAREERKIAEQSHGVMFRQLKLSETAERRALTKEEQDCLGVFTDGQQDYADWKALVAQRLPGTCKWLLQHGNYLEWEKQDSGPLLISADPGCGKSVLAKFLVDEHLPTTAPAATICYFFFKDQVQNTLQQALCAIIHQLLKKRPSLMRNIKDHRAVTKSITSLWSAFSSLVQDPEAGQVICVLDALDESRDEDRRRFAGCTTLKVVMTSRPYETITSSFGNRHEEVPTIRIPGESELSVISDEINIVIKHRVKLFSKECNLKPTLATHLEQRLLEIPHRTYLWIYLVFDYLEGGSFKRTEASIDEALRTLPTTVEDAYERILQRAQDKTFAFRAFCFVLAATRPLSVEEMNEALNTKRDTKSAKELDLESLDDFENTIRRECGLMLSVYENKVYFLHQTVREFLQSTNVTTSEPPPLTLLDIANHVPGVWRNSIPLQTAHMVLGDCCLAYLNLAECQELEANVERHLASRKWPGEDVLVNPRESFFLSARARFVATFEQEFKFRSSRFCSKWRAYCCANWRTHVLESECPDLQLDGRCRNLFQTGPMLRDWFDTGNVRFDRTCINLDIGDVVDVPGYNTPLCTLVYMLHLKLTLLVEQVVREDPTVLGFDERSPRASLLGECHSVGGVGAR
ncbi:hypothetical protein PG997_000233 [Apiospora hydei]|uniref:NWD NACHT-NTPase N-terminal domain-containing protein n=1 Tax=Apiospora hydei TaxID=1337664 RepID=A0ABR1XA56_9PEZI